jgi:hypothetical protein
LRSILFVPLACDLYSIVAEFNQRDVWLWEATMSRAQENCLYPIARLVGLVILVGIMIAGVGCGGAISRTDSQPNGDPLGLGVVPGPLGSTNAQTMQVRMGSEPNDRIVSLSLTINSLQTTNSGSQNLDLLTDPITVEFTSNAVSSEPVSIRDVYQDTYTGLAFPDMTGQVVFYDVNGQLVSQTLSVPAQTIPYSFVLGTDPLVLSISLDLAQTFTITDTAGAVRHARTPAQPQSVGSSSLTVNSLAVTAGTAVPNPAVGQPESGSFSFVVGKVTGVDTGTKKITVQPTSGDALQISYDDTGATEFVNCSPSMLTGMIVETEGVTQANGSVLASEVELIDNSQSGSELYGLLSGYAPDGMNYNLILEGGVGVNVTTGLVGKNITIDWLAASYSVNHGRIPDNLPFFDEQADGHLIFDESHVFPGQLAEVEWDTLIVPDPDSSNAGYMQPRMFELEEQTITGQVSNYAYNAQTQMGTFTLSVASSAPIKRMNPGLIGITVNQIPQTYLRNNPTFNPGDTVKVRGLLFVHPDYNNSNYQPSQSSPVAFVMVADRISK